MRYTYSLLGCADRDRLTSGISLSLSALIMSCTLYDVSGEVFILPLQVLVM